MAMFVRHQDPKNDMQARVAAELQERLNSTQQIEHKEVDLAFLEKQHQTRSPAGLIVVLLLLLLVAVIWGATKL